MHKVQILKSQRNTLIQEDILRLFRPLPSAFFIGGTEGKIEVIRQARERNIPFLGLCLGLHMAVIEFARNVCDLEGANSTEMDPDTPYPVIDILPEQKEVSDKGGTMRLGGYPAILKENSLVRSLYGVKEVSERHRHRYEVNPEYHAVIQEKGMVFSGASLDNRFNNLLGRWITSR